MFQLLRPIDCLPPSRPPLCRIRCQQDWTPLSVVAATAAAAGASGPAAAEEWFFQQPVAADTQPFKVRTLLLFTIRSLNLWRWKWREGAELAIPGWFCLPSWPVVLLGLLWFLPALNVRLSDSSGMLACWVEVTYTQGSLWSWRGRWVGSFMKEASMCCSVWPRLVCLSVRLHEALTWAVLQY